ncbi:uncharacterized protein EAE98_002813 [Botrytis deweyae]|uniref:Aminoglycoside phosphotransferase domain-containing protein n=2 Tax=Botrytis TaxID=33196 RepID=A0A4Z1J613_9HELO|nr:uncharacterized protein EAE98_002813 [Botrytis deweyae]KAF7934768.1 hypothetical protein EAE98_002813 [Botrytis deweyae]KAF7942474.1 hypothetical protein EAE99_000524 [Botrytis elliptica]TGO69139.1 hypothetical protein BELL_0789g00040 [Botrytis elliptica]
MSKPLTIYEPFEGNTKEEFDAHLPNEEDFLLCHNCGWSVYHQVHYAYVSSIKCMCNGGSRGVWYIGDDYVLKERNIMEAGRASYLGPDVSISKFLTENSTVPVAKYIHHWKDSQSHFSLAERVPGDTLMNAGNSMTKAEKRVIAKEVVKYLIEVRKFTSPKIEAPDGSMVRDRLIGSDQRIQYVTDDVEEWWTRAKLRLSKEQIARWEDVIRDEYPVKGPYVLTHGDLDASNIMVKDGHVTGIIDWEHGGYLPEWWEPVATRLQLPPLWSHYFEEEWKLQIGPWPDKEVQFARTFKNFFKEYYPREVEPPKFYDTNAYMKCTNYRRYVKEYDDGFKSTVYYRELRKKESAEKEAAALAALKKLSLEEKEKEKEMVKD